MKPKQIEISWQSVEPATDTPIMIKVTAEITNGTIPETFQNLMRQVRGTLIAEGRNFDPGLTE